MLAEYVPVARFDFRYRPISDTERTVCLRPWMYPFLGIWPQSHTRTPVKKRKCYQGHEQANMSTTSSLAIPNTLQHAVGGGVSFIWFLWALHDADIILINQSQHFGYISPVLSVFFLFRSFLCELVYCVAFDVHCGRKDDNDLSTFFSEKICAIA